MHTFRYYSKKRIKKMTMGGYKKKRLEFLHLKFQMLPQDVLRVARQLELNFGLASSHWESETVILAFSRGGGGNCGDKFKSEFAHVSQWMQRAREHRFTSRAISHRRL